MSDIPWLDADLLYVVLLLYGYLVLTMRKRTFEQYVQAMVQDNMSTKQSSEPRHAKRVVKTFANSNDLDNSKIIFYNELFLILVMCMK